MRLAVAVLWAALTACAAPQTGAEGEASGAARSVGTSGANVEITEKGGGGADQARSLRARARSLTRYERGCSDSTSGMHHCRQLFYLI